jgi:Na+-translocating ferredoxin:NAD+ oxidoreductase subunit D
MDTIENRIPVDKIEKLVVSASPHLKGSESVADIMWRVVLALSPLTIHAVLNYGLPAIITIVSCVAGAVLSEHFILVWQKKKTTIGDGSAFLTGLLLALCLPPNIPWFMALTGAIIAIAIAKQIFGGLGDNVFNPALVGRAFIMACFPAAMTTWGLSALSSGHEFQTFFGFLNIPTLPNFLHLDAVTSATPLEVLKHQGYEHLVNSYGGQMELYKAMFFGHKTATGLGETSAVLTILGGIYLIIKGYIKWQVPVVMVGTVGLLTWIFGGKTLFTGDPIFHMMAGGLLLGAFFMATDMVTTPITTRGKIVFAFGCGAITVLIRLIGGYPEGVCYSILLMNTATPLLDRAFVPVKFGTIKNPRKGMKHVEK